MRQLITHIEQKSKALSERSIFQYLRDPSIDAHQRLRFVPCCTHFIMTFADLCRFVLPEHPPRDHFDELVNSNLSEEADHWKWFLADLTTLGVDPTLPYTKTVKEIWSDATVKSRMLGYELCRLSLGMTSLEKLALVLAIEATGKVALEASTPVGREVAKARNLKLVYFGGHHLESENEHTLGESQLHELLSSTTLDSGARHELERIVGRVFQLFEEFLDEAFEHVKRS